MQEDDGGIVVALERGGRIIGVYPDPDGDNLLWVSPSLGAAESELSPSWNVGGERTWLSPELEFNLRDLNKPDSYIVQPDIDPGRYRQSVPESGRRSVRWTNEGAANAYRSGDRRDFRLTKRCRLVSDPLAAAGLSSDIPGYSFVGYEMETSIRHLSRSAGGVVSLWTIVQVPDGGVALAPTYGAVRPKDFFADTGEHRLSVEPGGVRFRIVADEAHKISLKFAQTTGRFGYCRRGSDGLSRLLIRQIAVRPSFAYLDAPLREPEDTGHCVQLYSDDGALGAFGELEHHSHAYGSASDGEQAPDVCQMWGYSGPEAAMERIAARLLGMSIEQLPGEEA
ncbi:DUF6786 family protein [Cohnella fermenti]|uniref:Uncharacterized protein n=1 Tax=Cohnella fermenti TaxID=2565925 RepID=A0A4S4CA43_9BACL|nr:DUF6786 family protein [Cohnella fermenti]THF84637.1 hypothetical protein E6C55_01270 [Cohnella fermenti]